jgi:hypothetical protein
MADPDNGVSEGWKVPSWGDSGDHNVEKLAPAPRLIDVVVAGQP